LEIDPILLEINHFHSFGDSRNNPYPEDQKNREFGSEGIVNHSLLDLNSNREMNTSQDKENEQSIANEAPVKINVFGRKVRISSSQGSKRSP